MIRAFAIKLRTFGNMYSNLAACKLAPTGRFKLEATNTPSSVVSRHVELPDTGELIEELNRAGGCEYVRGWGLVDPRWSACSAMTFRRDIELVVWQVASE